jgi:hypothetical protein
MSEKGKTPKNDLGSFVMRVMELWEMIILTHKECFKPTLSRKNNIKIHHRKLGGVGTIPFPSVFEIIPYDRVSLVK